MASAETQVFANQGLNFSTMIVRPKQPEQLGLLPNNLPHVERWHFIAFKVVGRKHCFMFLIVADGRLKKGEIHFMRRYRVSLRNK